MIFIQDFLMFFGFPCGIPAEGCVQPYRDLVLEHYVRQRAEKTISLYRFQQFCLRKRGKNCEIWGPLIWHSISVWCEFVLPPKFPVTIFTGRVGLYSPRCREWHNWHLERPKSEHVFSKFQLVMTNITRLIFLWFKGTGAIWEVCSISIFFFASELSAIF